MISAALGLDISQFSSKIDAAKNKLSGLSESGGGFGVVSAVFATAAAGIAAAAGAAGAAAVGMWNAMDAGGRMVDLQEQTGIGIETLLKLETAFVKIGMSAGDVGTVINKMQKAIATAGSEGGPALAAFNDLGLSISELTAMRPEAQLKAVGDAVAGIEDPAKKAQAAMEVFGKSGGRLLPLLAAGGLDQVAKQLGNQARLMAENAGVFDRVTDVLETAGAKVQGFFVGMASAIAPQLLAAVDAFEGIDLSGLGQQIGGYVAVFLEAFSSGQLGALFTESLVAGGQLFLSAFGAGLQAIVAAAAQAFVNTLNALFSGSFLTMLIRVMLAAAEAFVGAVLKGLGASKLGAWFSNRAGENVDLAGESAQKVLEAQRGGAQNAPSITDAFLGAVRTGVEGIGASPALDGIKSQFEALQKATEERAAAARETFKAPTPGGVAGEGFAGGLGAGRAEPIVSSLARLGGAFTGTFGAADPQLDQMRQQTTSLQGMLGKLDQLIANTAPSNSISGALTVATLA